MGGGMNFLRGYVRVRLQSKEPERFLNLCAARRICIWAILRRENFYELCLGARDFFRLKEIAFKTGSQLKILEKRGLPFFFQRNPYNKTRKHPWEEPCMYSHFIQFTIPKIGQALVAVILYRRIRREEKRALPPA